MKKTFIEMQNKSSVADVKIYITVCNQEGDAYETALQNPEDLLNDIVNPGDIINLVFSNWEIYSGVYEYIDDEDGQLVLYIRGVELQEHLYCLPYEQLIGYYKSNRE